MPRPLRIEFKWALYQNLNLQIMDTSEIKEFSLQQRLVGRPSLEKLFDMKLNKQTRILTIKVAHLKQGWTTSSSPSEITARQGVEYFAIATK
jgi:hypothetical protein